jgi:hypothetical protein
MKSIIIAGPSRSGKTTLAKMLNAEFGCFVISLDKLVAIFNGAYPQLDIRLNWNREKTADNIAPFIGHFLGAFSSGHGFTHELNLKAHAVDGNRFVLESAYFNFDKILPVLKTYGVNELKERFTLIGLSQDNKTADEFVRDFKKYDTADDWTYGFTDGELTDYAVNDAVPSGRAMTAHLLEYGFTVYDTSTEREKVFTRIITDVSSLIEDN